MNVALLSIGDELLIGKTVNTNASWLGEHLSAIGFDISCVETISDNRESIVNSLARLSAESNVVIVTGGLGPTNDDITKLVLCEFFQTELVFNQQAYEGMVRYATARNQEVNAQNLTQAQFPKSARLVPNPCGTASGMWFEKDQHVVVSLPGVPSEMKRMMEESVIPWLRSMFDLPAIVHRHINVADIAESKLAEIIADWESALPSQVHLAYLPAAGVVKLRLSCKAENEQLARAIIAEQEEKLMPQISQYVWGYDDETIEEVVGNLLLSQGATVATAESCTGGTISAKLTRISGSSAYYWGSVISYDNSVKINELQVAPSDIENYGVVSEAVVRTMASQVRKKIGTTYGVATSGIAGPTGGSAEKPVGTVWIAVASDKNVVAKRFQFGTEREHNVEKAAFSALRMLQLLILQEQNN
ncbi:MAG: competence/damage-inducible protein A [Bacteroidales bacterium]|nr:competence/damage-inducible protein A [Bacteroidales bacterium]